MKVEKIKPPVWEELSSFQQQKYLDHIYLLYERGYLKYSLGVEEEEQTEQAAKAYYNSTIKHLVNPE